MIWLLTIPPIIFFTFKNLYESGFPGFSPSAPRYFLDWCFMIAVGCFISSLISLVPCGIAALIGNLPERHGIKDKEYSLVALRQQDGFAGEFYFLGAGRIGDRQYYFWYRRTGDAIVGGKTTRSPGVRIYEDGADNPRMVTFKTEYLNPRIENWIWIVGLDLRDDEDWYPDFHIPKGAIKEGFTL